MDDVRDPEYHDRHIDDEEEWDDSEAVDVTPKPSGMTVFSVRLPSDELDFWRRSAESMRMSLSELVRSAVRARLSPATAIVAISASASPGIMISTSTPLWSGGHADQTIETPSAATG
jgi:hypothetical protein